MMIILLIPLILISITFHEYAHGWVAYKLGDPTPKIHGRLTLNPLAHIDPFGTIILPFLVLITSGFAVGYAKPVPINPYHFKNPKKDMMWVGIAGPAMNFLIAIVLSLMVKIKIISLLSGIIIPVIILNLILAVFNLIPIPPLDGSRVVAAFLPSKFYYNYLRIEKFGFFIAILLILLLVRTGLFMRFINVLVAFYG